MFLRDGVGAREVQFLGAMEGLEQLLQRRFVAVDERQPPRCAAACEVRDRMRALLIDIGFARDDDFLDLRRGKPSAAGSAPGADASALYRAARAH